MSMISHESWLACMHCEEMRQNTKYFYMTARHGVRLRVTLHVCRLITNLRTPRVISAEFLFKLWPSVCKTTLTNVNA